MWEEILLLFKAKRQPPAGSGSGCSPQGLLGNLHTTLLNSSCTEAPAGVFRSQTTLLPWVHFSVTGNRKQHTACSLCSGCLWVSRFNFEASSCLTCLSTRAFGGVASLFPVGPIAAVGADIAGGNWPKLMELLELVEPLGVLETLEPLKMLERLHLFEPLFPFMCEATGLSLTFMSEQTKHKEQCQMILFGPTGRKCPDGGWIGWFVGGVESFRVSHQRSPPPQGGRSSDVWGNLSSHKLKYWCLLKKVWFLWWETT